MGFFDGDFKHELLIPSLDEVAKAFFVLSAVDVAMLIGLTLWGFVLLLSLKGIDRRDAWVGITYILFMTAAGVTLVLALPSRLHGASELAPQHVLVVLGLATAASLRWLWRRPLERRMTAAANGKEKGS